MKSKGHLTRQCLGFRASTINFLGAQNKCSANTLVEKTTSLYKGHTAGPKSVLYSKILQRGFEMRCCTIRTPCYVAMAHPISSLLRAPFTLEF